MRLLDRLHERYVVGRRASVLGERLAELTPDRARLLDVGCGDGLISSLIKKRKPGIVVQGIEVQQRESAHIPVATFDGRRIPYESESFDGLLLVDVLHHTEDPRALLSEARRVARSFILLKDHTLEGLAAEGTLRFMDWLGNRRHGVALPYNYWPEKEWRAALAELSLDIERWHNRLNLYGFPARFLFDRSLHFIARLKKAG